jgi:hypothetical protein
MEPWRPRKMQHHVQRPAIEATRGTAVFQMCSSARNSATYTSFVLARPSSAYVHRPCKSDERCANMLMGISTSREWRIAQLHAYICVCNYALACEVWWFWWCAFLNPDRVSTTRLSWGRFTGSEDSVPPKPKGILCFKQVTTVSFTGSILSVYLHFTGSILSVYLHLMIK